MTVLRSGSAAGAAAAGVVFATLAGRGAWCERQSSVQAGLTSTKLGFAATTQGSGDLHLTILSLLI